MSIVLILTRRANQRIESFYTLRISDMGGASLFPAKLLFRLERKQNRLLEAIISNFEMLLSIQDLIGSLKETYWLLWIKSADTLRSSVLKQKSLKYSFDTGQSIPRQVKRIWVIQF